MTRRRALTPAASGATLGAAALAVPGPSAVTRTGSAGRADGPIVVHLRDASSSTWEISAGTPRVEVPDRGPADRPRRAAARR
ncbi:hypothetical protein AWW66_28875 [Micromonospora rosaria]|uniref:Uncharacterized protein n=1 Tax=Micromonospora rosaria TaxID=47874 RepID=A0A136PJJ7_9ACTN|nr:hypothetical protein AWW66_28875 [Micromonospora rosaria]